NIVVKESFVLRIPENLDPAAASPLLCAGITTYSPLRHWKVGKGMKVGVVGLGGLGHMAIKLAHAMGAEVILYTTSPIKREDGILFAAAAIQSGPGGVVPLAVGGSYHRLSAAPLDGGQGHESGSRRLGRAGPYGD